MTMPNRTPKEWLELFERIIGENGGNDDFRPIEVTSKFAEKVRHEAILETLEQAKLDKWTKGAQQVLVDIITMLGYDPLATIKKYNDQEDAKRAKQL